MYHYLTGAASWYLLTMITEVFGVRGDAGDLILYPKLLAEQFDSKDKASISVTFAGKRLKITYKNANKKDFGSYIAVAAFCDNTQLYIVEDTYAIIPRKMLQSLSDEEHQVVVILN